MGASLFVSETCTTTLFLRFGFSRLELRADRLNRRSINKRKIAVCEKRYLAVEKASDRHCRYPTGSSASTTSRTKVDSSTTVFRGMSSIFSKRSARTRKRKKDRTMSSTNDTAKCRAPFTNATSGKAIFDKVLYAFSRPSTGTKASFALVYANVIVQKKIARRTKNFIAAFRKLAPTIPNDTSATPIRTFWL